MKKISLLSTTLMKLPMMVAILTILSLLASCSGPEQEIEYVPFRESADGDWGLISPDGKVLVSEKFKDMPTMAADGRFFVPNSQGYYEMYTTDKQPKRLDGEYRYVSLFYHGKAFVAKRDKPLSVIDKEGNVVVWLEKMKGKKPTGLANVSEGFAVGIADTVQGMINTDGEWIIEPRYSSISPMYKGKTVAMDAHFFNLQNMLQDIQDSGKSFDIKDFPEGRCVVYNNKGEKLMDISSRKYQSVTPVVFDKYIAVAQYKNGKWSAGILDLEGNTVMQPSEKYARITEINGDQFIFIDKNGDYGMGSVSGKTNTIKPEFKSLQWANDKILLGKKDENQGYRYLDADGNPIIKKTFENATPFLPANHKFAFVDVGENKITIINRKIERLRDIPRIEAVSFNIGDLYLRSDYIELSKFLDAINFSDIQVDDISFTSSVQSVLERQARYFSSINKPKAADYTSTNKVEIFRDIDGETIEETIIFPSSLSHRTYTTRKVIDYVDYYWGYYYYHNQTVPTGWAFTTSTPSRFQLSISNTGIMRGKLKPLLKSFTKRFEKYGSVIEQNRNASLISLPGGRKALIAIHPTSLTVEWGTLPSDASNIAKYEDTNEDLTPADMNIIMPYPDIFQGL